MIVSRLALLTALLPLSCTQAFVQTQRGRSLTFMPSSLSSNNNFLSDDAMRKDIEGMREEAKERLEMLSTQMEDMLKRKSLHIHKDTSFPDAPSFEEAKLPVPEIVSKNDHSRQHVHVKDIPQTMQGDKSKERVHAPPRQFADCSLLFDTRWKCVIQVGSTRYNAALADEGEKPLLVHLEIAFSDETLSETDELLQGSEGRLLEVKEAWIGASSMTQGRQRPVRIKSTGGWKVLPGQGPKGIDILRFYIDVEEEIRHSQSASALSCPSKRIYCTSGVFPMQHHNEAEKFKNHLRNELSHLVQRYEDLTLENERDDRLLSFDSIKRAKKMMDLRQEIKAMNQQITQARIRDPEKAMLRLSRKGDVGLTKEGQVCYKGDSSGSASEYLVLGKIEMASVDPPHIEMASVDPNRLRP